VCRAEILKKNSFAFWGSGLSRIRKRKIKVEKETNFKS
jgi:hypothetical protein